MTEYRRCRACAAGSYPRAECPDDLTQITCQTCQRFATQARDRAVRQATYRQIADGHRAARRAAVQPVPQPVPVRVRPIKPISLESPPKKQRASSLYVDPDRTCRECGQVKALTLFATYSRPVNCPTDTLLAPRYLTICQDCWRSRRNTRSRARYDAEKTRGVHLRRVYGLSLDAFQQLSARQNHRCAICDRKPAGTNNRTRCLYVDHDHATGQVRGLLCESCNSGLGSFRDDPDLLNRAREYLLTSQAVDSAV